MIQRRWFAPFADIGAYEAHRARVDDELRGAESVNQALTRQLQAPAETWRLTPTARSRLIP